MGRKRRSLEERFWEKVEKRGDDECWLWHGSRYTHWRTGEPTYGFIFLVDKHMRTGAHRVSWMLHNEQNVPEGMDVLHNCDNPQCVNPKHLRIGTHTENMREKFAKGRGKIYKGSANNKSKLTEDQVREIKRLKGQFTQRQLGAMFNISYTIIGNIHRGKVWRHVE